MGLIAVDRGDPEQARARFRDAIAQFDAMPIKYNQNVFALIELSRCETALGRPADAEESSRRAVALAKTYAPNGTPSFLVGSAEAGLGEAELAAGHRDAARSTLARAADTLAKTLGPSHPETIRTRKLVDSIPSS